MNNISPEFDLTPRWLEAILEKTWRVMTIGFLIVITIMCQPLLMLSVKKYDTEYLTKNTDAYLATVYGFGT